MLLPSGDKTLAKLSFAMEPYLRQLGLPTKLDNQKIILLQDVFVAKEGEEVNVEQSKILKLLGFELGEFKFRPIARWSKGGQIKEF